MDVSKGPAQPVHFLMPFVVNLRWQTNMLVGEIPLRVGLQVHEVHVVSRMYHWWPEANS